MTVALVLLSMTTVESIPHPARNKNHKISSQSVSKSVDPQQHIRQEDEQTSTLLPQSSYKYHRSLDEELPLSQQQQQQQQQQQVQEGKNTIESSSNNNSQPQQLQRYYMRLDDVSIRQAVHNWVTQTDQADIVELYGPISDWDVSQVTDMRELFAHARWFDEDLSRWDVSRVTDMSYMFAFCSSFTGSLTVYSTTPPLPSEDGTTSTITRLTETFNLKQWDTSRVSSMAFMFHQATSFVGDGLVEWDVSQVQDLSYFAQGASHWNSSLWRWNTANVINYNRAFHNATTFSQELCWPLHPQAIAIQTFCGTAGAKFACDSEHILELSEINAQLHDCCACDYSAKEHYYYYNGSNYDDDIFWDGEEDNQNENTGIIVLSCIWAMVLIMIFAVVYVTMKRRHEVRQWFESKILGNEAPPRGRSRSADGREEQRVIAILIGLADEIATTASHSSTGLSAGSRHRADSPPGPPGSSPRNSIDQDESNDNIPIIFGQAQNLVHYDTAQYINSHHHHATSTTPTAFLGNDEAWLAQQQQDPNHPAANNAVIARQVDQNDTLFTTTITASASAASPSNLSTGNDEAVVLPASILDIFNPGNNHPNSRARGQPDGSFVC